MITPRHEALVEVRRQLALLVASVHTGDLEAAATAQERVSQLLAPLPRGGLSEEERRLADAAANDARAAAGLVREALEGASAEAQRLRAERAAVRAMRTAPLSG